MKNNKAVPDGVYKLNSGNRVYVKDGVLYIPVEVVHPLLAVTSGGQLFSVDGETFIRTLNALDLVASDMKEPLCKLAERLGLRIS